MQAKGLPPWQVRANGCEGGPLGLPMQGKSRVIPQGWHTNIRQRTLSQATPTPPSHSPRTTPHQAKAPHITVNERRGGGKKAGGVPTGTPRGGAHDREGGQDPAVEHPRTKDRPQTFTPRTKGQDKKSTITHT